MGNLGVGAQPTRMTEVSQAMNELSQINSVLLERLNLLGERLQAIRTAKLQNTEKDSKETPQPCKLASDIRQRAIEVNQAVAHINLMLEEIEL